MAVQRKKPNSECRVTLIVGNSKMGEARASKPGNLPVTNMTRKVPSKQKQWHVDRRREDICLTLYQ